MINHLKVIAEKADAGGNGGVISYRTFIKEVLYAEKIGYYTRKDGEHKRVGRETKTDFYTAESLGPVFKKLVLGAIKKLLGNEDLGEFTFVEIGAEPGRGLFEKGDLGLPFGGVKIIRPGDVIEIPEKSIVFANELLDAQPFNRLIYKDGRWRELGVRIENEGGGRNCTISLNEQILPELSAEVKAMSNELPDDAIATEGYQLDLPLDAENLLKEILSQDWKGLLVLFDYGFLWEDLVHNHPQGTARAYHRHKQHNDLLANPGDQDITCHVCWDRLIRIVEGCGFNNVVLERQESFFVHHAMGAIEEIVNGRGSEDSSRAGGFNYDKQTLQELIHPSHMGHKFQVLWGRR